MFSCDIGEVFKSTFFYSTPPVAASVVFAVKQLSIQCYNDKCGLKPKVVMEILFFISLTPHYHFHPLYRHLDISRVISLKSGDYTANNSFTDVPLSTKSTQNVPLCLLFEYPSFRKQIRVI